MNNYNYDKEMQQVRERMQSEQVYRDEIRRIVTTPISPSRQESINRDTANGHYGMSGSWTTKW